MNKRISPFVSLSYVVGVVLGLYLVVVSTWADFEAAFYGFSRLAEAGLRGFSCPVLIARDETSSISLRVSNTTDSMISPVIKTEISTSLVVQEFQEGLELAPGESKKLTWAVGPENIDLGNFIFAKALVFSAYPLPNREATCGVYVINLPGSGRVILSVLVVLSLMGMGWGLYGLNKTVRLNAWLENHIRAMLFLTLVIVVGMVVSFWGGWVPSILLLAVSLLLIIILLGSFFMSERSKR